jgi:RNA polymerase sigma-54 factor
MIQIGQHQKQMMRLTPNQLQFFKMLQLPVLSLEQRIKEELEMNPMLEEGLDPELEQTQEQEDKEDITIELLQEAEKADKKDEEFDWQEFLGDDLGGYKTHEYQEDDRVDYPQPSITNLAEHLIEQLHLADLKEEEMILGEEIIGNIDDDGYLRRQLELILEDTNLSYNMSLSVEQSRLVLKKIQTFDPSGIGARDLKECLQIQIENFLNLKPKIKLVCQKILSDLFDSFLKKHYDEILKKLAITPEELKEAIDIIQKLNPKPGEGKFSATEQYVVPDFFVHNVNDELIINLNEKNIPPLRVNKAYREMIMNRKKKGISIETKNFVKQRLDAAKWFISSIYQRRDTMLRVMQAIVKYQREFFMEGEEHLKPMIYKLIADEIGMDVSTISRTVRGKYVETDYGVYELKYFFSEKIETSSGEEVSNKQIKSKIKEIILSEDPANPLTDDELVERLKYFGYNMARRTVAKYREQMSIPVARLRKKL